MSTRANIVIKEGESELWFYRHSDGYPEGTMPTLNIFLEWVRSGKIRDNVTQSAGWLVLIGAMEYATVPDYETETPLKANPEWKRGLINSISAPNGWKASAYEPTEARHCHWDIEYLYTINSHP